MRILDSPVAEEDAIMAGCNGACFFGALQGSRMDNGALFEVVTVVLQDDLHKVVASGCFPLALALFDFGVISSLTSLLSLACLDFPVIMSLGVLFGEGDDG